jgi:hypothetical protein
MGVPLPVQIAIAGGLGFAGWLAVDATGASLPDFRSIIASPHAGEAECLIKGNISQTTGDRIYHVPGQKYYEATQIDPSAGERWFCSEDEAKRAGWRKSHI